MEIGTVIVWVIVSLFLLGIFLFIMALLALLISKVVRRIDANKAIDNTASAMIESSHDTKTQATAMVLADTSMSDRTKKFFGWFENLSIASLCTIGLAFVVFLFSIFFI